MKRRLRVRPGLSILETVLAIGIIMIALVGALTLIIATIYAGGNSINRFIAINLAREGIEVARQRRDTNWLKRAAGEPDCNGYENGSPLELNNPCEWDSGLTGRQAGNTYDFTATAVFAPAEPAVDLRYPGGQPIPEGAWYFDFSPNSFTDPSTAVFRYSGAASERYVQWPVTFPAGSVGEQGTIFRRLLHFNPICRDITAGDDDDNSYVEWPDGTVTSECAPAQTKIGTWVVSTVEWSERGRTFSVNLEERLYRWQ